MEGKNNQEISSRWLARWPARAFGGREATGGSRSVTGRPARVASQMYAEGRCPAARRRPPSFKFNNDSLMQNMRRSEVDEACGVCVGKLGLLAIAVVTPLLVQVLRNLFF